MNEVHILDTLKNLQRTLDYLSQRVDIVNDRLDELENRGHSTNQVSAGSQLPPPVDYEPTT